MSAISLYRLVLPVCLLIVTVNAWATAAPNTAMKVAREFQTHVDRSDKDSAASLIASDAIISTPLGTKTADKFLSALVGNTNPPVWTEPVPGAHDNECIAYGTRKMGFVTIALQRTIEINDQKQIQSIRVSRKK